MSAPTAEEVFGPEPWVLEPTGIDPRGITYRYRSMWFAAPTTALKLALMLGGKVAAVNAITGGASSGSGYQQLEPNLMIEFSNGGQVNAGMLAEYYTHGYPQSYVDFCIEGECLYVFPQWKKPVGA